MKKESNFSLGLATEKGVELSQALLSARSALVDSVTVLGYNDCRVTSGPKATFSCNFKGDEGLALPQRFDWHRLLGQILTDALSGSPFDVNLEQEVNIIGERLDLYLIRSRDGQLDRELPDGLEDLAKYNLITFKSIHEPLDQDAIDELLHHYVGLRKFEAQRAGSQERMLPRELFRCFAVTTRFPQKLSGENKDFAKVKAGIYQIDSSHFRCKIIVTSQAPVNKRNAIWNLFSGDAKIVQEGAKNYEFRMPDMEGALITLAKAYDKEHIKMLYTVEEAQKDFVRYHKDWLTPSERLEGLAPSERLAGLAPSERIAGLAPSERIAGLAPSEILGLMSTEEILAYLKKQGLAPN